MGFNIKKCEKVTSESESENFKKLVKSGIMLN